MPANVTFCFTDRDFVTASEPIRFSFSEKEKLRKRKTAQGTAPRSEIHYVAAGRGGDIMNSMRLRPPRPPKERASRVRQTTEMLCTAEKVSVFGAKTVRQLSARHDSDFAFPFGGKVSAEPTDEV